MDFRMLFSDLSGIHKFGKPWGETVGWWPSGNCQKTLFQADFLRTYGTVSMDPESVRIKELSHYEESPNHRYHRPGWRLSG